jgi:hypothetical protein
VERLMNQPLADQVIDRLQVQVARGTA